MANAKSRSLGPGLSTAEQVAGFCYLPFYLFLLALGLQWISEKLGLGWTYEKSNTIWGPIFLHMTINAISMGIISIL